MIRIWILSQVHLVSVVVKKSNPFRHQTYAPAMMTQTVYVYTRFPLSSARRRNLLHAANMDEFSKDIVSNASTAINIDERKLSPSTAAAVRLPPPPPLVQLHEETMSESDQMKNRCLCKNIHIEQLRTKSATSSISSSSRSSRHKKRLIIRAARTSRASKRRRNVATSPATTSSSLSEKKS